jgi:RNA polymerase sigma-70 factor (ECF subfamily)
VTFLDPAELFDLHAADLFRYLVRRVGESTAEDVLSQTFLVAIEQASRYDPDRGNPRAWLHGIAANLLRHHYRSETRRWRAYARVEAEVVADPAEVATGRAAADQARRLLAAPIAALPPRDREVLLLFAWADLGYAEIASALGIPLGTVRSTLHRVRRILRATLTESLDLTEGVS